MQHLSVLILIWVLLSCAESKTTKRDRFFFQGNEAIADRAWEKAIHYFDNAIRLDPEYALAYNNRGVVKVNQGRAAEAILDYNEALNIDGTYYECLGNRAHAYELVRRYENALRDWKSLVELFPDSAFLHLSQGHVASRLKDYDAAEASFLQALRLNSSDDEARVNLGVLKYYENQFDSARAWLQEAITYNPQNGHAYNALNQIAVAEEQFEHALEQVELALQMEPDNPYFLNNRGFTYLLMDSLDLAISDINQSILLDGDNMWAFRNKGVYYLVSGNPETALRYFDQVEDSRAFVDELYAYMGKAYWDLGRQDEACESWQKGESRKSKSFQRRHCD